MKTKRKIIVLTSIIAVTSFLFGSVVTAAPPAGPLEEIWQAIFGLQDNVEDLQIQINEYSAEEGNISIPAAQFIPEIPSNNTRNYGDHLIYLGPSGVAGFWAGVQLPDGANITKVKVDWHDSGPGRNDLVLLRDPPYTQNRYLCLISSVGDSGEYTDSALVVKERSIVDNDKYAYLLYVELPASDDFSSYAFRRVFIEYELDS